MTFLLVLILAGVVAYLGGLVRKLQHQIALQQYQIDHLALKVNKLSAPEQVIPKAVFVAEPAQASPPVAQVPPPIPVLTPRTEPPKITPIVTPEPGYVEASAAQTAEEQVPAAEAEPRAEFNWEQFLGAKMLAWLGGLALFVGIAFFVKYSFDRDLVPPWLRVVGGFAVGLGLVGAGLKIRTKDYLVTAQTLVATGVVILYAVSFIARSFYGLINTPTLFLLMSAVTVGAFTLAIRMDAKVVAVLGILGGFITPLLGGLTRDDHPLALFGYALALDCGLLAIARRQRWSFLIPLAAIATVILEIIWIATALRPANLLMTLAMIAMLTALFVANARLNPDAPNEPRSLFAGLLQSLFMLGTLWFLITAFGTAISPVIFLTTLFLANVSLIALYAITLQSIPLILAVSACGGLLAFWISKSGTVLAASVATLIYAGLNALLPAWIAKLRDSSRQWPSVASVGSLGLMLVVLLANRNPGWIFWTALLAVNVSLLIVAMLRRNLKLALCGTITTALVTFFWITHLDTAQSLVQPLLIIGAFALLYFFAARPLSREHDDPGAVYFPAVPAAIPFLLLALLLVRLDVAQPTLLFGFAMLMNALLIFAAPRQANVFPIVALIGTLLLEALWLTGEIAPSNQIVSLGWFLAFSLFFTLFPLLKKQDEPMDWLRWYVSAAAGPIHFILIYQTAKMIWPQMTLPGIIPAVLSLPSVALFVLMRQRAGDSAQRERFTAIYGASVLFFITLIFPIQFNREWLTLGWALEGLALVWLNRRAPAKWLIAVGAGLLTTAFVRLALNPLVFEYHQRSSIPVLNWYLYTYGTVAVAHFLAARLVIKDEFTAFLRGAFCTMGTVLLFLLINIEIADLFATGTFLTFEFSRNFARDMTYSIAWSLFALTMLIIGVRRNVAVVRYAGLALMGITLLKLFLHDLTRLDALFRIGAFIGVAVILIFASWLYQRFLSATKRDQTAQAP